jgi:transcriptional regulator with GAF, ATPase, and Fis domain
MAVHGEHDETLRLTMKGLARGFAKDTALERTLSSVTAAAVDLVDGVDYADVMVLAEGRIRSLSPTSPMLTELDAVQLRLQQGPCLQAAVGDPMIRCTDLRDDSRWPGFAAAAVAVGVHSMLSFRLYTDHNGVGALNLFGRAPRVVNPAAEAIGALLATLAAVALITADKQQQFDSALASRDAIGQAKGILMNQFKVDAVRAFEMLQKLSQDGNTPLRSIAEQLIATL